MSVLVRLDVNKQIYRVAVKLPFIEIQSDYDVDTTLLGAKIQSTGNVKANACKYTLCDTRQLSEN